MDVLNLLPTSVFWCLASPEVYVLMLQTANWMISYLLKDLTG